VINSIAPPNSAILAGSGTGVNIWLVTRFKVAPLLNVNVITCEREYGDERDVMFSVTVLCAEPAPKKLKVPFVSDGDPAPLQKGFVGGANRLDVSTQLVKATEPAPVTDVRERLLAYSIPVMVGVMVGNVKFWAANQSRIMELPAAVSVIVRTEPSSCALSGPPGEFVRAWKSVMVIPPPLMVGHVPGPVSGVPGGLQTVWLPPGS
jgi:hypothetical protein